MAVFTQAGDTVSASSGSVTLFGANSGQTKFSLSGSNSSIIGGNGSIAGTSSGANSTLIGGQGVSLFNVTGSNSYIVGGSAGTTGVDLRGSTGPEQIFTNPGTSHGNMVVFMGSGADSFTGGGGNSTVVAGSGSDVFSFIKGHAGGTETIIGFNAKDSVDFGGYGYSLNNAPSEQVVNGSDVMTLSDGTKITFVGLDHKIF
jgi:hypothetical protein